MYDDQHSEHRHKETPKKKATTWPLNNSSPKQQPRRRKRKARTRTRKPTPSTSTSPNPQQQRRPTRQTFRAGKCLMAICKKIRGVVFFGKGALLVVMVVHCVLSVLHRGLFSSFSKSTLVWAFRNTCVGCVRVRCSGGDNV